jgi:hypothetical protein
MPFAVPIGRGQYLAVKPEDATRRRDFPPAQIGDHRSIRGEPTTPPNPTLEQLRRGAPWCWVVCNQ